MMVGWGEHSIGYHSDDGIIMNGSTEEIVQTGKPYGNEMNEIHVGGCGYISKTKEAFFTYDGQLLGKFKIDYDDISFAVSFHTFIDVWINTGNDESFVFDLKSITSKKSSDCSIV